MPYATLAQLRAYLPQLPQDAPTDALLNDIIERAADIVAAHMGIRFDGHESGFRTVRPVGTCYLPLPPHISLSVATVADSAGAQITGWEPYGRTWLYHPDGWEDDSYTVGAQWGYGDPPPSIQEITLEIAVNIWRARDAARFSDYVGAAGAGAIPYEAAFTAQQRAVMSAWLRRHAWWGA